MSHTSTKLYLHVTRIMNRTKLWGLGIHQRGVQWEGGAVDGGNIM